MAGGYGGQLVALDVNDPTFDASTPLLAANQITAGNITNQTNTLALQNQVMQRNALLNYYKSMTGGAQPAAATSPLSAVSPNPITAPPPTPGMLISNAASKATDADSWDASMAGLQKQGVTEAGQFIGRYTPKLQQQVIGAYAPPPTAPPANGNAGPGSPLGTVAGQSGDASGSPLSAAGGPAGPASVSPLTAVSAQPGGAPGGTPLATGAGSPLATLGILNPTAASNIANFNARMNYAQTGNPDALRIDPDAMAKVGTYMKDMSDSQKTKFTLAADAAGRAANAALTIPAGPQRDAYMQQAYAQMQKNGLVPPDSEPHNGPITDDVLQHIITQSMTVDQAMQSSGQTAGNIARAQLPSELAKIGATGAQSRLTQAADVPNKIAVERSKFVPVGADTSVFDPLSAGGQSAGTPPVAGGIGPGQVPAPPVAGIPGPNGVPALPAGTPGAPPALNKFSAEVPAYALPGSVSPKPGIIIQGKTPSQTTAENAAVDQYKETASVAQAATDVKGQLGTMKAQLDQGLNTNALAPQKAIISAYLNAVSGPDLAKSVTGIDPAQADVFNKDATRLGFALSRTLGAREAAQTIQAAIKANPNMMNTVQGNQTVINLLDKSADRQIDAQQYADAYYQKNGHYVGAESAFNAAHPAAEYVSQAVPYSLPRTSAGALNRDGMQPNVTYQVPTKTSPTGKAVWNAAEGHFEPVR